MVVLLGEQIKQLANENARVKTTSNEEEEAIQARVERRRMCTSFIFSEHSTPQ
jgi:hypothetical protein